MKLKKILSSVLAIVMLTSMSISVYASEDANTNVETVVYSLEKNLINDNDVETIDAGTITLDETISIPKQRSGYILESIRGTVDGALTEDDPFDFYVFTENTEFLSDIQFEAGEPDYTLTLGLIDYSTNLIHLSDVVIYPNERYNIDFLPLGEHLDYTWVVQSTGAYGASYSLTYDNDYDPTIFYRTATGDEYSIRNQKMYKNDVLVNTDYIYKLNFNNQYGYHKRYIMMEDANVSAYHVGAVEWYESAQRKYHDNVIVLKVLQGGTFTHNYYQNPPYINWGDDDAWGRRTPRAIDDMDLSYDHYLIYDIDAGKTIQFVSDLSVAWRPNVGDCHKFRVISS